jgi:hypothetical protein
MTLLKNSFGSRRNFRASAIIWPEILTMIFWLILVVPFTSAEKPRLGYVMHGAELYSSESYYE